MMKTIFNFDHSVACSIKSIDVKPASRFFDSKMSMFAKVS